MTVSEDSNGRIDLVDQLIPAPPRGRRRATLVAIVIATVVSTALGAYGGWLRPSTTITGAQWLGDEIVFFSASIRNDGPRSFELTGIDPRADGLSVRSVQASVSVNGSDAGEFDVDAAPTDVEPFPVLVGPGESATLTITFDIEECGEIDQTWVPLHVDSRLVDPPLPWWDHTIDLLDEFQRGITPMLEVPVADVPADPTQWVGPLRSRSTSVELNRPHTSTNPRPARGRVRSRRGAHASAR